jgi:hypothetical protein
MGSPCITIFSQDSKKKCFLYIEVASYRYKGDNICDVNAVVNTKLACLHWYKGDKIVKSSVNVLVSTKLACVY